MTSIENRQYNLALLLDNYRTFLSSGKDLSKNTIKNYYSDVTHFFGWLAATYPNFFLGQELIPEEISEQIVEEYKSYLLASQTPNITINRRLSSLRSIFDYFQTQKLLPFNPAKYVENLPKKSQLTNQSPSTEEINTDININQEIENPQPVMISNKVDSLPYQFVIGALMFIMLVAIGIGVKNATSSNNKRLYASSSKPVFGARVLSFGGKLADSLGTPITEKTKVQFKLYNDEEAGRKLYASGVCQITPDREGNFSTLIGRDCGNEIPTSVFTDNESVFIGVSIGTDPEMSPRQQIANVGFAINSQTIQGLGLGSGTTSVPYINSQGDVLLSSSTPAIRSTLTSAAFVISSAKALTLQSAGTGDITLHATESGNLKFLIGGVEIARVSNSGRFGVGTNSPDAKIELADTTEQLRLTYADDFAYTSIMTNSGGDLTISPSGSDTLLGGRLGIGVSNPSYTLEVGGDAKIADGNKFILGSSTSEGTAVNGSIYYNSTNNKFRCYESGSWKDCDSSTGISGTAGFIPKWNTSSTFAATIIYETNSRIGVGTTTPSMTLDISGSARVTDNFTIGDSSSDSLSLQAGSISLTNATTIDLTNSSTTALNIESGLFNIDTSNSRVGIGTTAPTTKLQIVGGNCSDDAGGGGCTADYAELYPSSEPVEKGDLLVIDKNSNTFKVKRSTSPYESTIIGVVSSAPAAIADGSNLQFMNTDYILDPTRPAVALAGRVPVKIAPDSKPIQPGDPLTSSSIYGRAMKSEKPGFIIGKALEAWTPESGKDKILLFVSNTWFDQTVFISDKGSLERLNDYTSGEYIYDGGISHGSADSEFTNDLWTAVKRAPKVLASSITTGLTRTDELISKTATIANARIDKLTARSITVEEKITSPVVDTAQLIAQTVETKEASVEGTLTAGNIESATIEDLRQKDTVSAEEIRNVQELVDKIKNDPKVDVDSYQKLREDVDLLASKPPSQPGASSDNLTNYGQTTLFDTTILGTTIINNISIKNNEILSMNDELKLSALSQINLFDGAVMVTRDGTITLQGELVAKKGVKTTKLAIQNEDGTTTASIDASGSATFADISIEKHTSGAYIASSAEEQDKVLPNVKAGTAAAGSAIMTKGETQLVIYSNKLAGSSLVYLSPTSSTQNQTLYVSEKKVCTPDDSGCEPYFIVTLDNPIDTDIEFNWWIIR